MAIYVLSYFDIDYTIKRKAKWVAGCIDGIDKPDRTTDYAAVNDKRSYYIALPD